MDLKELAITQKYIDEVVFRREKGEQTTSEFYKQLAIDESQSIDEYGKIIPSVKFSNLAQRVFSCARYWFFDYYRQQAVQDLKSIQLCHNKFCPNCQKLMSEARYAKFMPTVKKASQEYQLYHLTLTVPNCSGTFLRATVSNIFKKFPYMVRYFKGDAKVKGIDFGQYGYMGAIRSFECTFNAMRRFGLQEYHPHLHVIVAFKKDLNLVKHIVHDKYSFDNNKLVRKFSDFEILIQKIWYLLNVGQRVNIQSISEVPDGYTCTLDPIDERSYMEVFKYATKPTDDRGEPMDYDQFKVLYLALDNRRQIQGYGIFRLIQEDESLELVANAIYDNIVQELRRVEDPIGFTSDIYDIQADLRCGNQGITRISRMQHYNKLLDTFESIKSDFTEQDRLSEALQRLISARAAKFAQRRALENLRMPRIIQAAAVLTEKGIKSYFAKERAKKSIAQKKQG